MSSNQYAPSWWPAGYAPEDDDTLTPGGQTLPPTGFFLDPRSWSGQTAPQPDAPLVQRAEPVALAQAASANGSTDATSPFWLQSASARAPDSRPGSATIRSSGPPNGPSVVFCMATFAIYRLVRLTPDPPRNLQIAPSELLPQPPTGLS